ncbi:MAG: putative selenate reductase subunit YgfK [Synergistaceae bacterium]|jgi:putative selenate reductase|nr:putative selenate reductase subunit YgfK [Synergistaceae bacterium]
MSHIMRPQPFGTLLRWIVNEHESTGSIFGIHKSLFYVPKENAPYSTEIFGQKLATPFGPAAGPNSQLTQNIVASWLGGARFIELKTVQIMDELEFGRPCIDMEDEGYNAEWSQELKLEQSVREYIKGWTLLHVLQKLLGWEKLPFGTVFNMSVGYNLDGIKSSRMQKFMGIMTDASEFIEKYRAVLAKDFPRFADIEIPSRLIDSVTLSTMHGCPPEEIQKIGLYLLEEKGLHLILKLNPTLLGKSEAMKILHEDLAYTDIEIHDSTFDHDLQYPRAVEIVSTLKNRARELGLFFGVKLTNTFAMINRRGAMPGEEMYMSGRSLYPITMQLFDRLSKHFGGDLPVSYSAGADELNVGTIFACGALPVTMASDLLKPGGYAKFRSCIEALEAAMKKAGVENLKDYARGSAEALDKAAKNALSDPRYKKSAFEGIPKVKSSLGLFDCVAAPCMESCAVCQDVPSYAWQIAQGDFDGALASILRKNALPGVTGHVCTHRCQSACTRNNYDSPVAIRALKRFAAEHGNASENLKAALKIEKNGYKAAVVGSGPSGLAAAMSLALAGMEVTVYEEMPRAGGMMALAPTFRLPREAMDADVRRVTDLGVKIELNHKISEAPEKLLEKGFDAVYVACGFPEDAPFDVPGLTSQGTFTPGVFTSMQLLKSVAAMEVSGTSPNAEKPALGKKTIVVGGGNTAMDVARTASRLTGNPVSVVYRRTRAEMPAIQEERDLVFHEGNELIELAAPSGVVVENGRVAGLECERCRLGDPDASGRRAPVPTSEKFVVKGDSIVIAIGQGPEKSLFRNSRVITKKNGAVEVRANGMTSVCGVFAGGDAVRTPAIVIQGCADGAKAAEAICAQLGIPSGPVAPLPVLTEEDILKVKALRAHKSRQHEESRLPLADRKGFELAERTFSPEDAVSEARRCLQCASFCDKCVEVCPNRANVAYKVTPIRVDVPRIRAHNGTAVTLGVERVEIVQARQVLHVDDFCNECGNCSTFCVHEGRPYRDKPRLVLNEPDFVSQDDNVFKIDGNTLRRREGGMESRLTVAASGYFYENESFSLELDNGFAVRTLTPRGHVKDCSLRDAVEMAVMYNGIKASASHLLSASAEFSHVI